MWCIPEVTSEFKERMEEVLDLYAKPYNKAEPVICFDEKSKELREDIRPCTKTKAGKARRRDYEYKRNGTANIFLTVEPKGGYRRTKATEHRTRPDFAWELKHIASLSRYRTAKKLHVVLDNLNTHNEQSLVETFGKTHAVQLMKRVQFHYTPKHASWLNMAEIEIGVMNRQAIRGRIGTKQQLAAQLAAWQKRRNRNRALITWMWTTKDARKTFRYNLKRLS